MKKTVIITSCIEVDNNYPLTYSKIRSFFTTQDRYNQTIKTLFNLVENFDKETCFYLVDASPEFLINSSDFEFVPNFKFVSVKLEFPQILKTVTTHPNKSHCEQLLLYTFLEHYKGEILDSDYFFKVSGRYQIDKNYFNINYFNNQTHKGFYFKEPLEWDWEDSWGYEKVDLRQEQGNNKLYQYCTVAYGWSRTYLDTKIEIAKEISKICSSIEGLKYDVETLIYFLTRKHKSNITHMPWLVVGNQGTYGTFAHF
jgi:hypothetical protein